MRKSSLVVEIHKPTPRIHQSFEIEAQPTKSPPCPALRVWIGLLTLLFENDPNERKEFPQSQYLLSVMFKLLGKEDLYQAIKRKHSPDEPDNDPKRQGRIAGDRFCVLEGDTERFYPKHLRWIDPAKSDEIALAALYCLQKKPTTLYEWNAGRLWQKLRSRYIPSKGVLEMDEADLEYKLYSVYKVALFGIVAKKMNDVDALSNVRAHLREWQHEKGGWITDLTPNLELVGVANIETTALAVLSLVE